MRLAWLPLMWLLALHCPMPASAETPMLTPPMLTPPMLTPYEAHYTLMRGLIRGESVVTLSAGADGTWTYHSRLTTTGLVALFRSIEINETTSFRIRDGAIVPLRHQYTIEGAGRRDRDFDIAFDWAAGRAHGVVSGEAMESELEAGIVDRHTMTLALMLHIAAQAEFPRHYVLLDRGNIRHFDASELEGATLRTGAGEFETRHFVQQRSDDPSRRFLTWLAPAEHGYIPVRIQSVDDDGSDVTLTLRRFSR